MAKKVYLVDTENVGSVWVSLLSHLEKNDKLLLFYTVHSSGISYEDLLRVVDKKDRFEMVECFTGRNGLDFQLVSYLGYLIKSAPKTEYIIIANDHGYDAAVRFWSAKKVSITRLKSSQVRNLLGDNAESGIGNEDSETMAENGQVHLFDGSSEISIQDALAQEVQGMMVHNDQELLSQNILAHGNHDGLNVSYYKHTNDDIQLQEEKPKGEIAAAQEPKTVSSDSDQNAAKPKARRGRKPKQAAAKSTAQKTMAEPKAEEQQPEPTKTKKNTKTGKSQKADNATDTTAVAQNDNSNAKTASAKEKPEKKTRTASKRRSKQMDFSVWLPEGTEVETRQLLDVFCQAQQSEIHKIYVGMVKTFGQAQGGIVYHSLKPHLDEIYKMLQV